MSIESRTLAGMNAVSLMQLRGIRTGLRMGVLIRLRLAELQTYQAGLLMKNRSFDEITH
jgi:hypothetical protein